MLRTGDKPGLWPALKQWVRLGFRVIPAWLAIPLLLLGVQRFVKNPDGFPAEFFAWLIMGVCAFVVVITALMSLEPRRPFPWKPFGETLEDQLHAQAEELTPISDLPRWQPSNRARRPRISRPVMSPRCRQIRLVKPNGRFIVPLGSRQR